MKKILLGLLLALASVSSFADYVWSAGTNSVILRVSKPCLPSILENVKDEYKDKFRAAEVQIDGEVLQACWIQTEDGAVHVVSEDGYLGALPAHEFRELKEI